MKKWRKCAHRMRVVLSTARAACDLPHAPPPSPPSFAPTAGSLVHWRSTNLLAPTGRAPTPATPRPLWGSTCCASGGRRGVESLLYAGKPTPALGGQPLSISLPLAFSARSTRCARCEPCRVAFSHSYISPSLPASAHHRGFPSEYWWVWVSVGFVLGTLAIILALFVAALTYLSGESPGAGWWWGWRSEKGKAEGKGVTS